MSRRAEQPMVPRADFRSYYGRPVLQRPTWRARYVAGYFFLGGLAAGSSLLGAGGDLTGRPALRRAGRLAASAALSGSVVLLISDLGRPGRFLKMLRVFRPTSPMNMGSWILAAYGSLATVATLAETVARAAGRGRAARIGRVAGIGAAAVAPGLASYTAVILADTAVPTWHEARRELPFVFAGSAASAAGGLAMVVTPLAESGPARWLATFGSALELGAGLRLERRIGMVGEPLRHGRAGRLLRLARATTGFGSVAGSALGGRSRTVAVVAGLAMVVGSAFTRFGVFYAGVAASQDPRLTVVPQRERVGA